MLTLRNALQFSQIQNLGSEIYERLPDSGSQADDLNERVGSDEYIGSRMAGGHDSDMYSSLDRAGENGDASIGTGSTERLVRPSQMSRPVSVSVCLCLCDFAKVGEKCSVLPVQGIYRHPTPPQTGVRRGARCR